MATCVAFLRGINVGGHGTLPMKELVAILEGMGARNARTYIQSGNAVFDGAEADMAQHSARLAAAIAKRRGFEPAVHVMTAASLAKALAENPFPEATGDPASLHLGFLASPPKRPDLETLARLKKASERFHLARGVFYLHAPEGIGRSKLAAGAEKAIGVSMTSRNWRTACKVMEMAGSRP